MEFFENNSRFILDNLSTQIYIIDHHYNVMGFNNMFVDKVKQSRENIIGQPCYKLTHQSDIPCWQMKDTICPAREAFEKNKRCRTIHKHTINNKVIIEEVISTPIKNGQYILEEYRNVSDLLGLIQGILPICAGCKKIRDDQGNWHKLEGYFHDKTGTNFSHSICPECAKRLYPDLYPELIDEDKKK